jgi:hypothetical protein
VVTVEMSKDEAGMILEIAKRYAFVLSEKLSNIELSGEERKRTHKKFGLAKGILLKVSKSL